MAYEVIFSLYKVIQIFRSELRRLLVLAATRARDELAVFAAIRALSEFGRRFPFRTVLTKLGALASIAHLGGISLSIFHR